MVHRSRLASLIIDCRTDDLDGAAAFWAAALGADVMPAEPNYVALTPQGGLTVEVQAVDHPSRVHLDIASDDIPAEVARLEKLGARRVADIKDWTVMEAPTGHRFCVIPGRSEAFRATATVWED
jgi:predicted enzyme related to lactoylglutathione lyase